VQLPERNKIVIPAQDELGQTVLDGQKMNMQKAFDTVYTLLRDEHSEYEYIWNLEKARHWGKQPASEKQVQLIKRRCKGFNMDDLNKLQASQILNRVLNSA
jgi:hypothetical protein